MNAIKQLEIDHQREVRINEIENMLAELSGLSLKQPTQNDYDNGQMEMYEKVFQMLSIRFEQLWRCEYSDTDEYSFSSEEE